MFDKKELKNDRIDPNGQTIFDHSNYEVFNETAHIFDARLVFKRAQYEQFGIYKFQVNNNGGSVIHKINFTLKGIRKQIIL